MLSKIMVVAVAFAFLSVGQGVQGQESGAGARRKAGRAAEAAFYELHDAYLARYKPLLLEREQAWWEANTTGDDKAFERQKAAKEALVELHSDPGAFARLKALKEGGLITDPTMARQLDVMVRQFLPGQADKELQKRIVKLETEVEQVFNTHRSLVDGKELTQNDVLKVLGETRDSAEAKKAWQGYMAVGLKVEKTLRELVALRNKLARSLGYPNFYNFKLSLQEIDEAELMALFDELDALTAEPFAALKKQIDPARAARFDISAGDLRPWHYGDLFFQEAPELEEVNLDDVYKDKDLLGLAKKYYASLGMEVDDILARSDLYEKPGKSPHAFATDMDRVGDVRILCNLKPNLRWMDTLLHELGHAVYDKYIDRQVPFILRTASHSIMTEGYAMMMGAMAKNEDYLAKALALSPEEAARLGRAARRSLRAEKLIFCRWTQVMVRFDHGMYADPDQDLGKLWWDLKRRYQGLHPPADVSRPDYGAKMHVVLYPAYYHSYMMGDLFASQLQHRMAEQVLGGGDATATSFYGHKKAGDYLREKLFGPGNLHSWSELVKLTTGEPLSAKHFARQYVK